MSDIEADVIDLSGNAQPGVLPPKGNALLGGGIGPVKAMDQLEAAFKDAVAAVDAGGVAVVDMRVITSYAPTTASALTSAKA